MGKNKDTWKKAGVLIFLGLIVLGFTVPGFINPTEDNNFVSEEPHLCKNDAECYLTCDDLPVKVICLENLCQQNSCEEYNPFPFGEGGLDFELSIDIEGKEIELENRKNAIDIFVDFEKKGVNYKVIQQTSRLPLSSILEKANLKLVDRCLVVDSSIYCESDENINSSKSALYVNGEPVDLFERYIPKQGDIIEMSFE